MPQCAFKFCKNNYRNKDGTSYFRFPLKPAIRASWIAIVAAERREENYKPSGHSVICSHHFDEKEISGNSRRRNLRKTAIPKTEVCNTSLHNKNVQLDTSSKQFPVEEKVEECDNLAAKQSCNPAINPVINSSQQVVNAVEEFGNWDACLTNYVTKVFYLRKIIPQHTSEANDLTAVEQYTITTETIMKGIEDQAKENCEKSDMCLDILCRNYFGQFNNIKLSVYDVELNRALKFWGDWYNMSPSFRHTPLMYKCYMCHKGWWRLHPFGEHLKQHSNQNFKLRSEPIQHEYNIIASTELIFNIQNVVFDSNCWRCGRDVIFHKHSISPSKYQCSGCGKSMVTCTRLKEHESICESHIEMTCEKYNIADENLTCPVCELSCLSNEILDAHMLDYHLVRSDEPVTLEIKTCKSCNGKYLNFKYHDCPAKRRPYECDICYKKFSTQLFQQMHMEVSREHLIKCTVCERRLSQCTAPAHYLTHSTNYCLAYMCRKCDNGMLFTNEMTYASHMDSHKRRSPALHMMLPVICVNGMLVKDQKTWSIPDKRALQFLAGLDEYTPSDGTEATSQKKETDKNTTQQSITTNTSTDPFDDDFIIDDDDDEDELEVVPKMKALMELEEKLNMEQEEELRMEQEELHMEQEEELHMGQEEEPQMEKEDELQVEPQMEQEEEPQVEPKIGQKAQPQMEQKKKPHVELKVKPQVEPEEQTQLEPQIEQGDVPQMEPEEEPPIEQEGRVGGGELMSEEQIKNELMDLETIEGGLVLVDYGVEDIAPTDYAENDEATDSNTEIISELREIGYKNNSEIVDSNTVIEKFSLPQATDIIVCSSNNNQDSHKGLAFNLIEDTVIIKNKMEIKSRAQEIETDAIEEETIAISDTESTVDIKDIETLDQLYECKDCDYSGDWNQYVVHVSTECVHTEFSCDACKDFQNLKSYLVHLPEHDYEPFTCPECLTQEMSAADLQNHVTSHILSLFSEENTSGSRSLCYCKKCGICVRFNRFFKHWQKHANIKCDDDVNSIQCDSDGDQGRVAALAPEIIEETLDTLRMKSRRGEWRKPCIVCSKEIDDLLLLKKHLIEHLLSQAVANSMEKNSTAIKCYFCDKEFQMVYDWKFHMRDHSYMRNYECDKCSKHFSDSVTYCKHRKGHGSSTYECHLCGCKYQRKRCFINHLQLHKVTVPCDICGRACLSESELNKHIAKKHSQAPEPRPFPCSLCSKRLRTWKEKEQHMWAKHDQRRVTADCTFCGKRFRTAPLVKKHMKLEHWDSYKETFKKKGK